LVDRWWWNLWKSYPK